MSGLKALNQIKRATDCSPRVLHNGRTEQCRKKREESRRVVRGEEGKNPVVLRAKCNLVNGSFTWLLASSVSSRNLGRFTPSGCLVAMAYGLAADNPAFNVIRQCADSGQNHVGHHIIWPHCPSCAPTAAIGSGHEYFKHASSAKSAC